MEPAELQATLRLLAGLLAPCVALLCCLNGLLLLRRRGRGRTPPGWGRRWPGGRPPAPLWRVLVSGGGAEAEAAAVASGSAGHSRPPPCLCGQGQPGVGPAQGPPSTAAAFYSSGASFDSSGPERRPLLAPPNSPAGSWAARGLPDRAFDRQHPTTQRKAPRGRPAFPAHPSPFEYGSSIRRGDQRTHLSSANLTASQGPGLDSDFGASAGVSLRILSSDSDESPTVPLLHPQQSGRFEWDYYDPSYQKSPPLQHHLPGVCSKQYWL